MDGPRRIHSAAWIPLELIADVQQSTANREVDLPEHEAPHGLGPKILNRRVRARAWDGAICNERREASRSCRNDPRILCVAATEH